MTDKERFGLIFTTYIKRDGSKALLDWLEKSDFFTAPASTKFHGAYEGGLVSHSLNVYDCLRRRIKADNEGAYDGENHTFDDESVAIVSLLHDICKVNFYKVSTRNVKVDGVWTTKEYYDIDEKFPCGDHADKSVIILQNFMRLEPDEILAIRAHMGGFDSAVQGGSRFLNRIYDRCRLAVHLALADMEASYLTNERDSE